MVALLRPGDRALLAQAPIVQPGAPGEPSRELSAETAIEIADTRYSPVDVRFMQDMIELRSTGPTGSYDADIVFAAGGFVKWPGRISKESIR